MKKIRKAYDVIARDKILRIGIPSYLLSLWLMARATGGWVWFWCWFANQIVTVAALFLLGRRTAQRRKHLIKGRESVEHWRNEVIDSSIEIAAAVHGGDLFKAQQCLPRYNEAMARMGREAQLNIRVWTSWL